jgi:pimeloyl-ACP methyl ester carboxylesterase
MRTVIRPGWLLAGLGLAFLAPSPARADLIFFKDGFVLEGKVKREHTTEFDPVTHEPLLMPKGFFMIDTGACRIYFSPAQIRDAQKKDPPPEEKVVARYSKTQLNPRVLPPFLEVQKVTPWNAEWERSITFRTTWGSLTLPQHVGLLTPSWARVDSMGKYFWSCGYATRELGPDEVVKLLSTHPDFKEPKDEAAPARATRRLRLCDFLAQAGWFDHAEKELDRLVKDLPEQQERVAAARAALRRMRAREQFEDVKRLHLAGQPGAVRRKIAEFKEADASEQMLADLREIKSEYDSTAQRIADAARLLDGVRRDLTGPGTEVLAEAAAALAAELGPDNVGRLETFVGQARQAERQRKNGKPPVPPPAELASLAVSGWLLGSAAAETRPETAVRLWQTRRMLLSYLRTGEAGERQRLLTSYLRATAHQESLMDEVLQMVPQLPPPEPLEKAGTDTQDLQAASGRYRPTYHLRLPPEYRPTRAYPLLIALPQAGEKPADMLRRWAEPAAANGYVLAVPEWDRGVSGQYNYTPAEQAAVLETLRDLRRRVQVDSDRVFLFGLGEGGTLAYDVSLAHPDLFAGVLPMGGGPDMFAKICWRNGQYLPFYTVSGNRAGPAEGLVRQEFENWIPRSYPMLWVDYKGRGVEWFPGEVPAMFDWMRTKRRAFPTQQLGTDGNGTQFGNEFCTLRREDNRFYWLSTNSIRERNLNDASDWKAHVQPATMTARIDPGTNDVIVRTSGLGQLTVWLGRSVKGTGMIDFDKPVSVKVNLSALWTNRKVTPSLGVLLEDLYQRGDRQMLFVARIDLELK